MDGQQGLLLEQSWDCLSAAFNHAPPTAVSTAVLVGIGMVEDRTTAAHRCISTWEWGATSPQVRALSSQLLSELQASPLTFPFFPLHCFALSSLTSGLGPCPGLNSKLTPS